MLNGVGDERIHRRHCFYMAGRREWRDSAAGRVWWGALEPRVCASFRCGFAPHSPESLISPLRGANFLQGRAVGGCGVCAPFPGKPYFTVERRKPIAGKSPRRPRGGCAPFPGKPYFTVEGRKLIAGKSRRRVWGFAPHSRESLISPLRGANQLPGRAPGGRGGCAPFPGKPYFTVEGRKPIAGKSHRRRCGFAPHTRGSLIPPLRGANLLPERGASGGGGLRLTPGKALFYRPFGSLQKSCGIG